jgi:hypothetical protein
MNRKNQLLYGISAALRGVEFGQCRTNIKKNPMCWKECSLEKKRKEDIIQELIARRHNVSSRNARMQKKGLQNDTPWAI